MQMTNKVRIVAIEYKQLDTVTLVSMLFYKPSGPR